MARTARIGLNILVIGLLFLPFALAVFGLRTGHAAPTAAQAVLLLPLLALPVWALRRLQLLKAPQRAPTLYD
ncbi:MAG: hypothetical protein AB1720_08255 [Pseudomonadota bacterium]